MYYFLWFCIISILFQFSIKTWNELFWWNGLFIINFENNTEVSGSFFQQHASYNILYIIFLYLFDYIFGPNHQLYVSIINNFNPKVHVQSSMNKPRLRWKMFSKYFEIIIWQSGPNKSKKMMWLWIICPKRSLIHPFSDFRSFSFMISIFVNIFIIF